MPNGPKKLKAAPSQVKAQLETLLSESQAVVDGLLKLCPFPVFITHIEDGRVLVANDKLCETVGLTMEKIIGREAKALGLFTDAGDHARLIEVARSDAGKINKLERRAQGQGDIPFCNDILAQIVQFRGQDCLLAMTIPAGPLSKTQRALRQSQDRFKNILNSITESYYEVDLDGCFIFFNDAVIALLGYTPEELKGLSYKAYTLPEDAPRLHQAFNDVYQEKCPVKFVEHKIQRKDGTMLQVETSTSLLRDNHGTPIGFYGVLRDRTRQKQAEEALRQSEESYRGILELAPDAISISRIDDGRYLQVNDAFCRLSGYSAEEAIGRTALELNIYVNPDDRKAMLEGIRKKARVEGMEIQFRTKPGEIVDTLVSARQIVFRKLDCMLVIVTNVTSLKKIQEALRQSEQKFRDIIETMEEGYYEVNAAGRFTFLNHATVNLHGYAPEDLAGMSYKQYIPPEFIGEVQRQFSQMYQTGLPAKVMEYDILRKDGTARTIEMSGYPLKDAQNRVIGFWGITRDRTEQKKAETALQKSEEMYRLLVNNANDGIYITQEGRIKFHNPKTAALTGYSDEALVDMPFADLVHPEDREIYKVQQRKMSEANHPEVFSFRILNKKKEILWVELNAISITWEGRSAALNFLRDVTPQKQIEAQLLQSRKMEAVGTLAGGIAHDFNNLLMGIKGNITIALMDLEKESPIYEKLTAIEQYVMAGADLTRQLLGTARGGKYEARPTALNQLVDKSAELFGRTKKEVRIHKKFEKNLWTVEVDRGQLEQVLLNLFVNAWQAMANGGDLFIETQNVVLDEYYVKPYAVPPGNFVKLSVTDTGTGIAPQNLKRIFDPFFTTKSMSTGTGLGLSSAYGIITNHGGIITVYSELGSGATFNIYLPASDSEVVRSPGKKKEIIKGHGTLLFVDDEKGIVEVGSLILQRLGYKVIVAHSGEEAVEIYRQQPNQIDLVLVDMIMPGMSGSDTFNALRSINPDQKIILSSGYSVNDQARDIIERGCNGFIQKPFSIQDLSAKLRQVLDGPNGKDG